MSSIKSIPGTSLAFQWGGLCAFIAGEWVLSPSGNYNPSCCSLWSHPLTHPTLQHSPLPIHPKFYLVKIYCSRPYKCKNQRRNQTVWQKGKTACRSKSKVYNCQSDWKAKKILNRIMASVACPRKTPAGTAVRVWGSNVKQCAQAWVHLLLPEHTFQILAEISISN